MKKVALKLIKTGHAKPEQVNKDGNTALIWACQNEMTEVVLELIKIGYSKPEQVDISGDTALIWACEKGMKEVAYEIVPVGAFTINDLLLLKPEWACVSNTTVALELIKTGHANPEQVDNDYCTAFHMVCNYGMEDIALELIRTGKYKPDYIAKDGNTAFSWACENGMKEVAYELVQMGIFTINDLLILKPEWIPVELFIMNPVDVTEVDI